MPVAERENDVGGRFTNDPGRNSQRTRSEPLVVSFAYASPATADEADRTIWRWTGAPPCLRPSFEYGEGRVFTTTVPESIPADYLDK